VRNVEDQAEVEFPVRFWGVLRITVFEWSRRRANLSCPGVNTGASKRGGHKREGPLQEAGANVTEGPKGTMRRGGEKIGNDTLNDHEEFAKSTKLEPVVNGGGANHGPRVKRGERGLEKLENFMTSRKQKNSK